MPAAAAVALLELHAVPIGSVVLRDALVGEVVSCVVLTLTRCEDVELQGHAPSGNLPTCHASRSGQRRDNVQENVRDDLPILVCRSWRYFQHEVARHSVRPSLLHISLSNAACAASRVVGWWLHGRTTPALVISIVVRAADAQVKSCDQHPALGAYPAVTLYHVP